VILDSLTFSSKYYPGSLQTRLEILYAREDGGLISFRLQYAGVNGLRNTNNLISVITAVSDAGGISRVTKRISHPYGTALDSSTS
jgi:hypothetical protein